MILAYGVAVLFLVVIVWLALGIKRIGSVSHGEPIKDRDGAALLLVDLQSVFWEQGPYSDTEKRTAQAAIHREVEQAKTQGIPVVAVRQEWSIPSTKAVARLTMKGQAIEGSAGTELADVFDSLPDMVVVKRVQDAFETGELDEIFDKLGVGALRIVGLDMNYCIQKTALAARNRRYDVTIVKDGTLSAAPTEATEKRLAAHGVALH